MAGPSNVTVLPPAPSDVACQPEHINDLPWHRSRRPPFASGFDSGWEPSSPSNSSLLSPPGLFGDIPTPSAKKRSNVSGRCLAAGQAYDCIVKYEDTIRSTLMQCRWNGEYLIQVGFNEKMLRLERGTLQEIHMFFEKDIAPSTMDRLTTILHPFPVHFHTPSATHCVPELPPQNTELWEVWARHGIYRASNQPPTDNDAQSSRSGGNHNFSPCGGSSGAGNDDGWGGWEQEDSDSGSDNSESGDGSNNGNGRPRNTSNKIINRPLSRGISIPFSSTLTCEGEDTPSAPHPSIRFRTHACVDIKMESNSNSKCRPTDSNWGGPWLEAKMTVLDAGIQEDTSSSTLGYSLGLSQVRLISSSSPSSILRFSPSTVRAEDDDFITKTERTKKGGIQATLGMNPSVRLEGTFGSSSGEEKVQKRWEILPHCLGSDMNDITGHPQTTMMWKYVHNDKCYQRVAGNVFDPRPSAIFGLSRAARKMPVLEVDVVMHYSCATAPVRAFRGGWPWFAGSPAPAYVNFLHQVSVVVDLEKVQGNSWVVGLGASDKQESDRLGFPFAPVVEQAESEGVKESQCDVFLGRALYGRISLSEEERKNARPLLSNASPFPSPAGSSQTLLLSSRPLSLTPSPSPSPPSLPNRGAAEYITKIPKGYVVNGRRFKDRATALRKANMFRDKANIRYYV